MTPRPDAPPRANYSVPEIAVALRISEQSVRRMLKRGELGCDRIGSRVVIPVEAYEAYRAARRERVAAAS